MDKNRYETQKHVVEVNLEDAPQQFFTREDLHWLFTQAEKVERYEKALKDIMINCDNPSFRVVASMALNNRR